MIPSMNGAFDAFTARLYINDIHVAYIKNEGRDIVNQVDCICAKERQIVKEAEAYCLKLPPLTFELHGKHHSIDMTLSKYIDEVVTAHLINQAEKKFEAKIAKSMKTGIVVGIPGDNTSLSYLDLKAPIDKILTLPGGPERIKVCIIMEILPALKDGLKIINTNIPEDILKDSGLKEGQYLPPESSAHSQKKQQPSKKKGQKH